MFLWSRPTGGGDTCGAPGACGHPDERRQRGTPTVNLDVGAIVNASQLNEGWKSVAINAWLSTRYTVVTRTALTEYFAGPFLCANHAERLNAFALLGRSMIIADNPTARVMALSGTSNKEKKRLGANDKVIFGTGDRYGWTTVTTDGNFVKVAAKKGVNLDVAVFESARYRGD